MKTERWAIVLALSILVLFAVGCGKQVPPYWPDLAVYGDAVYVAEINGQVFSLQAETGDVTWSYPVIKESQGGLLGGCSAPAPSDGPFFAAPAVNQEFVFLGSAGEQTRSIFRQGDNLSGLRALNQLGTPQWEFKGTMDRTVASPTLSDNTIYLPSSDHNVYAIDLETREARWAFETGNWVWASPLVAGDVVYIASMDHSLYAVDTESGAQVWSFDKPAGALPAAPAIADGVLYFGSLDGYIYAVDAQSGTPVWPERQVEGGVWATPRIEGDTLYFGTLKGKIYALDTADGTERWQKQVEGEVRGTPAYADGTLYFGCENGKLYAFDAQDGTEELSPLGQQLEKASFYTSPVFDGERLYAVATDGQVFALDLSRKAIVWRTNPLTKDQEE